jgi:hypothetical protein
MLAADGSYILWVDGGKIIVFDTGATELYPILFTVHAPDLNVEFT